jgi:DNA-binding winged helix-turn-helix (wHTH) protein/Tol biopolymer transport system component
VLSIACAYSVGIKTIAAGNDRLYDQLGVQGAMSVPTQSTRQFRFGEFKIDLHTGELSTNGQKYTLSDKPLQLLVALLERPGELVTREELKQRLWRSDTFVDFDLSLNKAMNRLRDALQDSVEQPRYIETLPRRGYRFVSNVVSEETTLPEGPSILKDLFPGMSGPQGPVRRRIRLRELIIVATLLAAGILVGAFAARKFWTSREHRFQQLTFRRGTVFSARFAPDGRTVLYTAAWDGNASRMFSNRPEFPESRSLGTERFHILAISRLGEMAELLERNFVAHRQFIGTLARAPLSGGAPREIAEDVTDADWTPDGNGLAIVRCSGGRYRIEFPIGKVLYETNGWISDIRFSKSGDKIAFADHQVFPDDGGAVAVVDLKGHKTVLSTGWNSIEGLAWSADGNEVWFAAGALQAVTLSGKTHTVLRTGTDITLHDISSAGAVLLSEDNKGISMMLSTPDTKTERDFSWLKSSVVTDITPDGKLLLFSEEYAGGGPSYSAYVRRTDGLDAVRLGRGGSLGLSANGKWAAAGVPNGYGDQIWILSTGPESPKQLESFGIQYVYMLSWLPDNTHFVYSGVEAGHRPRIYLRDVNGGKPSAVTPEGTYGAASWSGNIVSPDGKRLFAKDVNQVLWTYALDGGGGRRISHLAPADIPFQWTPDGGAIYLYRQGEVPARIYKMSVVSGKSEFWKELKPADPTGVLDIIAVVCTPDGSAYAYSFDRWLSDLYLVEGLK